MTVLRKVLRRVQPGWSIAFVAGVVVNSLIGYQHPGHAPEWLMITGWTLVGACAIFAMYTMAQMRAFRRAWDSSPDPEPEDDRA